MIVAIDGPSGSGKSSVSSRIAKQLGLVCLNTGMIYRGVALHLHRNQIEEEGYEEAIKHIDLKLTFDNNVQRLWLSGEDVTDLLMQNDISALASKSSKNAHIRDFVAKVQSDLSVQGVQGLVAEGRDITTVIFPNAEHKFFLNASYAVRAERRAKQLGESNELDLKELVQSMFERDMQDMKRNLSPLKLDAQAIYINTDEKSLDEVASEMISYIQAKV